MTAATTEAERLQRYLDRAQAVGTLIGVTALAGAYAVLDSLAGHQPNMAALAAGCAIIPAVRYIRARRPYVSRRLDLDDYLRLNGSQRLRLADWLTAEDLIGLNVVAIELTSRDVAKLTVLERPLTIDPRTGRPVTVDLNIDLETPPPTDIIRWRRGNR